MTRTGMTRWILVTALLASSTGLAACTASEPRPDPPLPPPSTDRMLMARASHTASPLPDGSVLIAGGCTTAGCGGTARGGQTEIYMRDGFRQGPVMVRARMGHTATVLPDGRILFLGGYPQERSAPLAEAEVFDPKTGSFSPTGAMREGRGSHTATLLHDGRVLVVGGVSGFAALSTAEVWSPATGRFTPVANMPSRRATHGATLLGDGRVLVVGGQSLPGHGNGLTASTVLYDPPSDSWTAGPDLAEPKYKLAVASLADGGAIVIGGQTGDDAALRLRTTEIYRGGGFTAGPRMAQPRYKISEAVLRLPDGRIVVAGNTGVEVFTGSGFVAVGEPGVERQFPAVALAGGLVLVTGGYSEQTQPTDSFALVTV